MNYSSVSLLTLEELNDLLKATNWFSQIGGPAATIDSAFAERMSWDWLPTSRDQDDPVHGDKLVRLAEELNLTDERIEAEVPIAKATLQSLRQVPDRLSPLVQGPHDLTPAAKAGALYAARMAAREIAVKSPAFWCEVMGHYGQGYWPCGLDDAGGIIIC